MPKRKKILRVIHSLNPACGGPQEAILQITPHIAKHGFETTVISLDPSNSHWLKNKPYKAIGLGPSFLKYGFIFGLISQIESISVEYDLVIVHGLWQFHSLATWLALKKTKKKYFVFTHGMLDPWFKDKYPIKHLRKLI